MKALMKLKYLVLLSVTGTIISLDQLTKHLVTQRFRYGESLSMIPGFFNLTYVRNPGAAFGLLSRWDPSLRVPFFIIVPILALGVIFYVFRKVEDTDLKLSSALSFVIGGAFGNLIDRAAYNYVVDFLDFHWDDLHFPAFNVADIAICVGVGFLILDIIQKERKLRAKLENVPHTS
ncbi:MAG: signal peptidase II [Deltaproteobacteria bacterium]|nr:signal peptidase II [Deltaproteobacteria bacterium]